MLGKPVDTIVITSDTFDRVPSDRCFCVFLAFVIHGLGCFLPWNLLFHSYEYFVCCKFLGDDSDIYRQYFLSFCALAALLAALVSTGIGLFIGFHGDTKRRVIPSIVVLIIMFILQVLFAVFDARDSSGVFLCITILNIVVIGAFIGLYLSSVAGIVAYFPDRYVNALVIGTSLGILIAICSRIGFKYYLQFVDAVVLINFALFNLLGNFLAGCVKKPYSRWISFLVFIRAILALIIFLFVNFEPNSRHNVPVLIRNDYVFMSLVIVFGFTHGYLNSMIQMLTTKSVEPYLSATTAVLLQLFIFAGCFFGIIGSFVYHFIATLF
ncbi:unnamed protein product [Rotaria sp. Silwood2]|nr:unnamed protein product [Rotaria sp. Silwood2]CAF4370192.1 unnamed protein product [Rotaria sp. Silwood2]CAF4527609.1 unnamed protein product [Rotaria sp. Silwood2]